MKLFVDDIRNAPDESWTVARTVNAAISAIDTFDFDVISLDHDISHQVSVGLLSRPYPCEETFTAVAYFIKAKYFLALMEKEMLKNGIHTSPKSKLPKIIIHTSNPAGAVKMTGILKDFDVEQDHKGLANRLEMEV